MAKESAPRTGLAVGVNHGHVRLSKSHLVEDLCSSSLG